MLRVGYYYCEECVEERLFVLWEPPWDLYACSCAECGYQFGDGGYRIVQRVVDARADDPASPPLYQTVAEPEPVLSREVVIAGRRKLRANVAERVRELYGADSSFEAAQKRLDDGLATEDPELRARLLNAPPIVPDRRKA